MPPLCQGPFSWHETSKVEIPSSKGAPALVTKLGGALESPSIPTKSTPWEEPQSSPRCYCIKNNRTMACRAHILAASYPPSPPPPPLSDFYTCNLDSQTYTLCPSPPPALRICMPLPYTLSQGLPWAPIQLVVGLKLLLVR